MDKRRLFRKRNALACTGALALALLLGLFLSPNLLQAQTTVTISSGTSNTQNNVPLNNFYNYSFTQQLVTASEFQAAGASGPMMISSVAFQYAYSSTSSKSNCTIYVGQTSKTAFASNTDVVPLSDLTVVYTGPMNFSSANSGWNTFNFTSPFLYNGVDNLVVVVDDNSGSYSGSSYTFYYTTTSYNSVIKYYSDSENPNPASPSSFTGTKSCDGNRSNMRFAVAPATCPGTTDPQVSGTTVTWTEIGTASQWELEYGAVGFTPGTGTSVLVSTTPSYTLTGLTNGTIYDIYVRSICGVGDTGFRKKTVLVNGYSFCGGSGTQADPYQICTETHLRNLSNYVATYGVDFNGVYFKLMNNIAMSQGAFEPIGGTTTPFRGHFNGANHTISNLTNTNTTSTHRGLFGRIIGASVDSLTISGTITGADSTGGIVGSAINSTITHCTNNATIAYGGSSYRAHGGIAGTAVNTTITDCRNTGSITGTAYNYGGIVGYASGTTRVEKSSNSASITTSSYYHGGIVGYFDPIYSSTARVGIFDCTNSGTIGSTSSSSYYQGGICGYFYPTTTTSGSLLGITNCVNKGTVNGYQYTGGICGYARYVYMDTNCNMGAVTSSYSYQGGILGYGYQGVYMRRCSNSGTITNTYTAGTSSLYVGGIVGRMNGTSPYSYLQYNVNTGTVTNQNGYTGGIAGYIYYTYCDYNTNSADVKGAYQYTGGICGYASTYGYIRYCLNGGLITGSSNVGGITGYSYSSSYTTYCLNVNNVIGTSNVAAIAGTGSVSSCYWDKQMCPTTYLYGTTTGTTYAKKTSELVGLATYPSSTYFTATTNMYPMPNGMRDSLGAKLAASPVFLQDTESVNNVITNFTVGNLNNVAWTSSDPSVISISGTNATVTGYGSTTFTGTMGGQLKHINMLVVPQAPTFCGGSGTQADPYLICTANTLDTLRQFVNLYNYDYEGEYFLVVNDLDMSQFTNWEGIGTGTGMSPFKGNFDGGGHAIRNLTINTSDGYKGLFGYVKGASTSSKVQIHDFTITGSVTAGDTSAAVCGYATYTDFYNIVDSATVSGSKAYHGGICGYAYYYVNFDSCFNHGTVQGTYNVGGIVGYHYYYSNMAHCGNTANITGTSYNVGGLAGYFYTGVSGTTYKIDTCFNTGSILGDYQTGGLVGYAHYAKFYGCENRGNVGGSYHVGGLAGYHSYYGAMENCRNYGDVTGTSYNVGGLAGYEYYQYNNSYPTTCRIYRCENYGDVSGSYKVGGLIGYTCYYVKTLSCTNYGDVSATSATSEGGAGGLVAYNYNYSSIDSCVNYGDVSAACYTAGGITSMNYQYSTIANTDNYGNVTNTFLTTSYSSYCYGTGGIAGANYYYSATAADSTAIKNCNNYGDIKSSSYLTGGIAGQTYYYGWVNNCRNYGNVEGTYYTGGIIGFNRGSTSTTLNYGPHVVKCANAGDVKGTYYVGGIAGYNGYSSSSYYSYVEKSVNVGRVDGSNYVGGIAGYSYGASSSYMSSVEGCLNAGIVNASTDYAGGIVGYNNGSYSYLRYCLNVGNVITPGTYKGAVNGYSYSPTSSYFDSLMCPLQYYYYGSSATTTTGMRTSDLTDGTFNPSSTYFTATPGLYPRPTAIANDPIAILAATPVFLDETNPTNHVGNVDNCFTVGTGNNVSWTADDPTIAIVSGSNGTPVAQGTSMLTATKDSLTKEVELNVVSSPLPVATTYSADIYNVVAKPITPITPTVSGCHYSSTDLPEGLSINSSTGEITGAIYDTITNGSFTVLAVCSGCDLKLATIHYTIVPDTVCAGTTVTLPAGKTWYYDENCTRQILAPTVAVDSSTVFYAPCPTGGIVTDFTYTGATQQYAVPAGADSLVFEVWGAQGGYRSYPATGGKGGYSIGRLENLSGITNLYVNVGGFGGSSTSNTSTSVVGGWNGGGYRYGYPGGGGATDIALQGTSGSTSWNTSAHLYSRIIVAGGGGSCGSNNSSTSYLGMYGGGLTGGNANSGNGTNQGGGNQSYSGTSVSTTATTQITSGMSTSTTSYTYGGFGFGGAGLFYSSGYGGAGGGGWYGGCGTLPDGSVDDDKGGSGGSGYVWTAATASNAPSGYAVLSRYYLTNANTIPGNESFPAPDGTTETGHEGNGFARITAYVKKKEVYIVNTLPRASATISGDTTICGTGATARLKIDFTGVAPYTYRITGDASDRTATSSPVYVNVSPAQATNYMVTSMSDANNCQALPQHLTGRAVVQLCGNYVSCSGDTVDLGAGTWYYNSGLSNPVGSSLVAPVTTTTYYKQGGQATVNVSTRPTATMTTGSDSICIGQGVDLILSFTGVGPFRYRVTGDQADRACATGRDTITVYPTGSMIYKITYLEDVYCTGVPAGMLGSYTVNYCGYPNICVGDTVKLPVGDWYYDPEYTDPVDGEYVSPSVTTTYYNKPPDPVEFDFTGSEVKYPVPVTASTFMLEVWGAEGGKGCYSTGSFSDGGKGGYSRGVLSAHAGDTLYVYVGEKGEDAQASTSIYTYSPSFNGGGAAGMHNYTSQYYNGGSGGGATDIRVNSNSLYARAIVAGGGGGGGYTTSYFGGYGGGDVAGSGYNQTTDRANYGQGATQTAGGAGATGSQQGETGSFGVGGQGGPYLATATVTGGGGGGGGWYGGGGGKSGNSSNAYPGGGGSGYVYTAATAVNYPAGCLLNSSMYLQNAYTKAGNQAFLSPMGSNETGHTGNGYARITPLVDRNSSTSFFTVTVNPSPSARVVDTVINICGAQTAEVKIVFNGTAPFTYRITGDQTDRVTYNNIEVVQVSPSISTSYEITYMRDFYCEASSISGFTDVIVCNQPLICSGDSATLPTGTWYYDQNKTQQVSGSKVAPAQTTTYYGANGTFTVSVYPASTARINSDTIYTCNEGPVTLTIHFTGTAPYTYRITGDFRDRVSNSATTQITVNPNTTRQYSVTSFYDAHGCEGDIDVTHTTVIVCDEPVICAGDYVELPAGSWFYDANLTNRVTDRLVAPSVTTTYHLYALDTLDFEYTGSEVGFEVPYGVDSVTIQVWGAEGGAGRGSSSTTVGGVGGLGGYATGKLPVQYGDSLYVYVGQKGKDALGSSSIYTYTPSFNGGGAAGMHNYTSYYNGGSGGGATDVRVNSNSLYARVIVAGGGGGGSYSSSYYGGYGGGTTGGHGYNSTGADYGQGGTQSAGGRGATSTYAGESGSFGVGGQGGPYNGTYSVTGGGGGGGGWYGGGGGKSGNPSSCYSGGGGSGYVYTASTATNYPTGCLLTSGYYLDNAQVVAGNTSFPSVSGSNETGHKGDGHARLIYRRAGTFTVYVNPAATASIKDTVINICGNETAQIELNFTGSAPFVYRITGDNADRVTRNNTEYITVNPATSQNYQITMMHDAFCDGAIANQYASVIVCDQPIICAGDTVVLPSAYSWFYDAGLTNQVADSIVAPQTTTTYYRNGGTYMVTVNPLATATLAVDTVNICDGDYAAIHIDFTGTSPFLFRLTGDTTDRRCDNMSVDVPVRPDTSTMYEVTSFRDAYCFGTIPLGFKTVIVCDNPIICKGDSVDLGPGVWYYDAARTMPLPTAKVAPMVTTSYYYGIDTVCEFQYTGAAQQFVVPRGMDSIHVQVWGAQGGAGSAIQSSSVNTPGGKGGYSEGTLPVSQGDVLYVYVGGSGIAVPYAGTSTTVNGGFNGGGRVATYGSGGSGGGATDVRVNGSTLYDRVIVAGGGSGTGWQYAGGAGGGLQGISSYSSSYAATQTSPGSAYTSSGSYITVTAGAFGQGGDGSGSSEGGAGGGGGWYGGGGSGYSGGAGGGSGYVWTAATAGSAPSGYNVSSSYYLANARTVDGATSFPSTTGSTEVGHSGNGYAILSCNVARKRTVQVLPTYRDTIYDTICAGATLSMNDSNYTVQGIYTQYLQTRKGCDSTLVINLTVNDTIRDTIDRTVCAGASFDTNGVQYYFAGQYTQHLRDDVTGCFNNLVINLTVNDTIRDTIDRVVCAGASFDTNGVQYFYQGQYTQHLRDSVSGCFNNLVINLTVNDTIRDTIDRVVCAGASFDTNGVQYFYQGQYTQHLRDQSSGCFNNLVINLAVNDTIRDTIYRTVCAGASFDTNGVQYFFQGEYTQHLRDSVSGCFNNLVIELTVNDTIRDTIDPFICTGVTFDTNGYSYYLQGQYTQHLRDPESGCFHNLVINLSVADTIRDTLRHTICPSGQFTLNNVTYTEAGTFRQHLRTSEGCDSILAVVIDVSDTLRETIHKDLCRNGYIIVNGEQISSDGTYKQLLHTAAGCDSILTIVVNYADTLRDTIHPIICFGDTFYQRDVDGTMRELTAPGVYKMQPTSTLQGCDSVFYVDLSVRDSLYGLHEVTICAGGSHVVDGVTYDAAGTYNQIVEASCHCDSSLTVVIHVSDTIRDTIYRTVCAGASFDTNGVQYFYQGQYVQYLRDPVNGCFNNLVINLTVNDTIRDTIYRTVCAGASFDTLGHQYFFQGVYTEHLRDNSTGCFNNLVIDLTVNDTIRDTIYRTVCAGASFDTLGHQYFFQGVFTEHLRDNVSGCFNNLVIDLTVNDTIRDTIYDTICAGTVYTFNNETYYLTGQYIQYLRDMPSGCFRDVVINLHVNDTIRDTLTFDICAGSTQTVNNETYYLDGWYRQDFKTADGCDSILHIRLNVADTIRDTMEYFLCAGTSQTVNNETYYIDGWYRQEFRTPDGCDSVLHIHINVADTLRDTIYESFCTSGMYVHDYGNRIFRFYTEPGTYNYTIKNSAGCDSVVTLVLTRNDTIRDTVEQTICAGSHYTHNNIDYYNPGWYRQHLHTVYDCDSIVHIHIIVNDTLRGHVYDTICNLETYVFNNSTYTRPGTYRYKTRTYGGCDSIAILHLFVRDTAMTHIYDTVCVNGTYNFYGRNCDSTGIYYKLLQRVGTGCDSTIALHLFVRDSIKGHVYDTICVGGSYRFGTQTYTTSGVYTKLAHSVLTGCDSIVFLHLKVLEKPRLTLIDSGAFCQGGYATIKANTNANYITWTSYPVDNTLRGQEHNMSIHVSPQVFTRYDATVDIQPYRCMSSDTISIGQPERLKAQIAINPEEITAENLQIRFVDASIGTIVYRQWLFPDVIREYDSLTYYTASIEDDTLPVTLIVSNVDGCFDTVTNVYPIYKGDVWAPSAFTPGRQGANRLFKVGVYNLAEFEIYIYTRAGLLVYHSTDPDMGWDGKYETMDCPMASYVYVIRYRTKSRPSETFEKKGSVMLVR